MQLRKNVHVITVDENLPWLDSIVPKNRNIQG